MEDYVEIGTITIFANVSRAMVVTEKYEELLAREVVESLKAKLSQSEYKNDVVILGFNWTRGCLLTHITIGVAVAALYKFVKDYKSFREGLLLVAKDVNNAYVHLRHSVSKHKICVYRDDFLETKLFLKNINITGKRPD